MFLFTRALVLKNKLSVMMYDRAGRVLLVATSETVTNEPQAGDWEAKSIVLLLPWLYSHDPSLGQRPFILFMP